MKASIVSLPGDGIGPEVVAEARAVLEAVASRFGHELVFEERLVGGTAIDATGDPLPKETVEACLRADAVLLGAVGGPKWDDPRAKTRPEQGLLRLRKELGVFANLRPVRTHAALASLSPLRPERATDIDVVFVRELTGGLYFGQPRGRETKDGKRRAVDTLVYDEDEIRRVAQVAFELARGRRRRVTSVDKANVLESSRLWREVVVEVARDYPDVTLEHQLVDSCAMRIVTDPRSFDVVVTENMFGDILTDEAAVLVGSIGLLPSASIGGGGGGTRGLYEPIHGSAPDIAGKGMANPLGAISSAAMLLDRSLGLREEAAAVERAVARVLAEGARTADLRGASREAPFVSTHEMGERVALAITR